MAAFLAVFLGIPTRCWRQLVPGAACLVGEVGMNSFGAGKEHRLRWFLGLIVPARSTEKEILAKGLFWLMALPWPVFQGQNESQPGMGRASLVTDISPKGIVPAAPPQGCPAVPRLCPCPHAVSVACGAMLQDSQTASPLLDLKKELTNQTPPPSPPSDAGGALRHGGASEWPPGTGEALKLFSPVSLGAWDSVALQRGLCWRAIFSPAR